MDREPNLRRLSQHEVASELQNESREVLREEVGVEHETSGMSREERAQKQVEDEVAALEAQIRAEERALKRETADQPEVTRIIYIDESKKGYGKYRSAMVFGDLKLVDGTRKLAKKAGYKFSKFFTAMEKWGQEQMKKNFKWGKYIPGLHFFYKDPAKTWEERDKEEEKKAKKEKGKKDSKKKRIADLRAGGFSKEQAEAIVEGNPLPDSPESEE